MVGEMVEGTAIARTIPRLSEPSGAKRSGDLSWADRLA